MRRNPELVLLGVALASVVASLLWVGLFAQADIRVQPVPEPAVPAAQPNARETNRGAEVNQERNVWAPPPAQSRGGRWIYDVFTPPEIFYDPGPGQFTVTPPLTAMRDERPTDPSEMPENPFSVRLVSVRRIHFRLQLIGFFEREDGPLGLFEDRVTAEVFLASKGRVLRELALAIEGVELRPPVLSFAGETTVHQRQARALIRDLATGETVMLLSTERRFCPDPRAVVEWDAGKRIQKEVGVGDEIEIDGSVYRIGEIQLSPASIIITRRIADGGRDERRTLTLLSDGLLSPRARPST